MVERVRSQSVRAHQCQRGDDAQGMDFSGIRCLEGKQGEGLRPLPEGSNWKEVFPEGARSTPCAPHPEQWRPRAGMVQKRGHHSHMSQSRRGDNLGRA